MDRVIDAEDVQMPTQWWVGSRVEAKQKVCYCTYMIVVVHYESRESKERVLGDAGMTSDKLVSGKTQRFSEALANTPGLGSLKFDVEDV